jgi:hypothetical protein
MNRLFKKTVIVILLFGTAIYLPSCMKEATPIPPVVITTNVSDITLSTALAGGTVTDDGGAEVTDIGVCWSTSPNPTTISNKISLGTGVGSFTISLTGLTPDTKYYVRAYATNNIGTAYGLEISFSTQEPSASVTTSAIVSFSSTSAVVTGNVIYGQIGNHLIGSGVCWSTSQNPTTDDSKTMNVTYSGIFTSYLTGLAQGTTYFVRAYAVYDNSPIIYDNELSFITSFEQGTGLRKANYPGGALYGAAGFSIGTKVYIGLGYNGGDFPVSDFWEWDQATNVWTKKADFPGNTRIEAVGFSIGNKGYIGMGWDGMALPIQRIFGNMTRPLINHEHCGIV